ncbi:MAG: SIS domain-containing protein, partial [Nitrospirae bacterium]
NVVGSTATREADAVLYTRAGPEIGVASTKAFTSQLAALSLFALALGIKRKRLTNGELNTLKLQLKKVPELIKRALKADVQIKEIAKSLSYAKDFLYLGRGINYPIALEGALKLKEISYIHAEGYPAGEMKHGPIALVEEGLPSVFIAPVDELFTKTLSNIEEIKARGGRVIAITDEAQYVKDKVDDIIEVPSVHPFFAPIVNVVPLQLLAYHIACLRGCNVDQPRNLAKSVTVE